MSQETKSRTTLSDSPGKKASALQGPDELTRKPTDKAGYILGHSPREIRRLTLQAAILQPVTERLLHNVNIGPGMRVLDLGCGAGDVSMLVAELVGPTGSVVGIDRSEEVLQVATERTRLAGLRQIRFEQASVETFSSHQPFDLVIGRYVLIHQSDPLGFLRAAGRLVKPNGFLAFHEVRLINVVDSLPHVPLWHLIGDLIERAFQSALPDRDVVNRLVECFSEAGLPHPHLSFETFVGGGVDSPLYAWVTETLCSLLPQLSKIGFTVSDALDLETLESSLRKTVVEARSQILVAPQICAWARI